MSLSQKRALQNYRARLGERGLARFEVVGRKSDRDLVRKVARKMAEDGPDAARLRATVNQTISGGSTTKGGIVAALRRSPLVGAGLDLKRFRQQGRDFER